jgi:hypothetical protein
VHGLSSCDKKMFNPGFFVILRSTGRSFPPALFIFYSGLAKRDIRQSQTTAWIGQSFLYVLYAICYMKIVNNKYIMSGKIMRPEPFPRREKYLTDIVLTSQ